MAPHKQTHTHLFSGSAGDWCRAKNKEYVALVIPSDYAGLAVVTFRGVSSTCVCTCVNTSTCTQVGNRAEDGSFPQTTVNITFVHVDAQTQIVTQRYLCSRATRKLIVEKINTGKIWTRVRLDTQLTVSVYTLHHKGAILNQFLPGHVRCIHGLLRTHLCVKTFSYLTHRLDLCCRYPSYRSAESKSTFQISVTTFFTRQIVVWIHNSGADIQFESFSHFIQTIPVEHIFNSHQLLFLFRYIIN